MYGAFSSPENRMRQHALPFHLLAIWQRHMALSPVRLQKVLAHWALQRQTIVLCATCDVSALSVVDFGEFAY